VRFLGRKVYLGAVVILISAMRQGPTPRRVRELSRLFGVDGATIARWQASWRDHVPRIPFWKVARGRLVPVVEIADLPQLLLEAFCRTDDPYLGWVRLLRFLSPITIPGGLKIGVFSGICGCHWLKQLRARPGKPIRCVASPPSC
jgi:hypothetical protein